MKYHKMQQSKFSLPVTATDATTATIMRDLCQKYATRSTEAIHLLWNSLTHNLFESIDNSYIYNRGTEMWSKMAITYANIHMWNFEKHLLDQCPNRPF